MSPKDFEEYLPEKANEKIIESNESEIIPLSIKEEEEKEEIVVKKNVIENPVIDIYQKVREEGIFYKYNNWEHITEPEDCKFIDEMKECKLVLKKQPYPFIGDLLNVSFTGRGPVSYNSYLIESVKKVEEKTIFGELVLVFILGISLYRNNIETPQIEELINVEFFSKVKEG